MRLLRSNNFIRIKILNLINFFWKDEIFALYLRKKFIKIMKIWNFHFGFRICYIPLLEKLPNFTILKTFHNINEIYITHTLKRFLSSFLMKNFINTLKKFRTGMNGFHSFSVKRLWYSSFSCKYIITLYIKEPFRKKNLFQSYELINHIK